MRRMAPYLSNAMTVTLVAVLVLAGTAYLAWKTLFLPDFSIDYQFIWLAGAMWAEGQNPYADEYARLGRELFSGLNVPRVWFYPPSWWPIATLSAQTTYETGVVVWRIVGALSLVTGIAVITLACHRHLAPLSPLRMAAFFAFATLMSATPIALSLGQTSFLSFLGAALFIAAWLGDRRVLMVAALFLLMLKPQIGLPFAMFLLARRMWWPSLAAGAVLSLLAAAVPLSISGIGPFLDTYLAQLGYHETLPPNHPIEMTGLRNLFWELFGWRVPSLPLALVCAALAFALGFTRAAEPRQRALTLAALLVLLCLFVPLHTYDMMLIAPLVVLGATASTPAQIMGLAGLLVIFRANNLAALTGFYPPETLYAFGSRLTTIGLLFLACAVLLAVLVRYRPTAGATAAQ